MRILCAPVHLLSVTRKCLEEFAPDAEVVQLDLGDKFAYWHEIKSRWTGEEDLLIIEQDMEFTGEMIDSMRDCVQNWCSYEYDSIVVREDGSTPLRRVHWCLGFTKISAFMQSYFPPGKVEESIARCKQKCGGAWHHIDAHIAETLKQNHCFCCKEAPHVHGEVIHHHDYREQTPAPPEIVDELDRDTLMETLRARGWQTPERIAIPTEAISIKSGRRRTKVEIND